jgi:hypothetical protein
MNSLKTAFSRKNGLGGRLVDKAGSPPLKGVISASVIAHIGKHSSIFVRSDNCLTLRSEGLDPDEGAGTGMIAGGG